MSELYELSDGWEWKNLDSISTIVGGGTPKRNQNEYWENGNIVWLSPTDLGKIGEIINISDSRDKITQLGLEKSSTKLLPIGTVLYSSRATIGKIAINTVEVSTNQGFTNFICNDDLNNKFLAFSLNRFTFNITALSNSTTFKEVNKSSIKLFKIPIPPLKEQKRIVSKLDTLFEKIDKAIELHEKNIKEADAFMGSVLNEVFEELEEKYEKITFEEVCNKITDGSHNPPKGIEENEFIMLSSKNVFDNAINFKNPRYLKEEDYLRENKRTDVSKGDVLLTIVGTIGRTAVVNTDIKFTLQRSVAVLKPNIEILDSYFLMYSLQKNVKFLMDNAKGAAQKGIYLKSIRKLEIVDIPLNTQQKVVKYLDEVSQKIEKTKSIQKEKLQNLKDLKASILDQAFKGEL